MKKIWLFLLILLLVGCFKEKNKISLNANSNINLLDGQKSNNLAAKMVLQHIFEGLTVESEEGQIIPAVAEKWEVSGRTWTFTINSNAKWENGKSVKAQDFVTAWERVISPLNNNENAEKMFMIKNAKEYNQSKVNFESVGINALDEQTLVIELKEENYNFDKIVAQAIFYPVNKEFYESNKGKYGTSKKTTIGNGAYKISSWKDSKVITLKKSKEFTNKSDKGIDQINFVLSGDSEKFKKMYKENEIQVLYLPVFEIGEFLKSNEKKDFRAGEVKFIEFNNENNFFSNSKVRKAISMALNKEMLESNLKEDLMMAESLGSYSDIKINYNPNEAKKILYEGLNELGIQFESLNALELLIVANDLEISIANFIKKQLNENLNLDVVITTKTSQMREQIIGKGDYQMTIGNFSLGLDDIDVYLNSKGLKEEGNKFWKNKEYNILIKEALKEKDFSKRVELIHQAEKLLMEELPIIPLAFSKKTYIIKENVKNVRLSNLSGELDFRYASIEKNKK